MNDAIYRLHLRADATHSRSAPRAPIHEHLERIPGVEDRGDGRFHFGEPDEHGVMEFDLVVFADGRRVPLDELTAEQAEFCHGVDVRVPRPWVMAKGPQVFALIFMMAEWNKWEVFDPQIEDTLQKEAVLQGLVAARQQQLEAEGRGGPPGTQAHFVQPDPSVVRESRPERPSGVKMPPPEPYTPRTSAAGARKPSGESQKRPWWKVW